MKEQKLMIARGIVFALALAVMMTISVVLLHDRSSAEPTATQNAGQGGILDVLEQLRLTQAQQLEGSWDITTTPAVPPGVPQPPSFIGHATIARGGAYFGSTRSRPLTKQHGAWVHLGGNDFAWTFTEDTFDAMGNFVGTIKVRVRATVTGRDSFVGVGNGEERDAAGNLVAIRCSTLRGARIKVEPLAPQCQNITPPQ